MKKKSTKIASYMLYENNVKFIADQARRAGLSQSCYLRLLLNAVEKERKSDNGNEKNTVEL